MKKLLLLLLTIGYLPYLFLFTEVTKVDGSYRSYDCHVETFGEVKENIGFGMVYYDPFGRSTVINHNIVLPYFFRHGEVQYAECAGSEFVLGRADFMNYKVGHHVHVDTVIREIKLFGHVLFSETGVESFGDADEKKFKEGETVLIRLVNDKDVSYFGGKPIKK